MMMRTASIVGAALLVAVSATASAAPLHSDGCCFPMPLSAMARSYGPGSGPNNDGTGLYTNVYNIDKPNNRFAMQTYNDTSATMMLLTGGKLYQVDMNNERCGSVAAPAGIWDNIELCVGPKSKYHTTFLSNINMAGVDCEVWGNTQPHGDGMAVVPGKCIPVGHGSDLEESVIYNVTSTLPTNAFAVPSYCSDPAHQMQFVAADLSSIKNVFSTHQ